MAGSPEQRARSGRQRDSIPLERISPLQPTRQHHQGRGALASGRPAVLHVDVDRRAHKIAPSLLTFKEMHQEPAG